MDSSLEEYIQDQFPTIGHIEDDLDHHIEMLEQELMQKNHESLSLRKSLQQLGESICIHGDKDLEIIKQISDMIKDKLEFSNDDITIADNSILCQLLNHYHKYLSIRKELEYHSIKYSFENEIIVKIDNIWYTNSISADDQTSRIKSLEQLKNVISTWNSWIELLQDTKNKQFPANLINWIKDTMNYIHTKVLKLLLKWLEDQISDPSISWPAQIPDPESDDSTSSWKYLYSLISFLYSWTIFDDTFAKLREKILIVLTRPIFFRFKYHFDSKQGRRMDTFFAYFLSILQQQEILITLWFPDDTWRSEYLAKLLEGFFNSLINQYGLLQPQHTGLLYKECIESLLTLDRHLYSFDSSVSSFQLFMEIYPSVLAGWVELEHKKTEAFLKDQFLDNTNSWKIGPRFNDLGLDKVLYNVPTDSLSMPIWNVFESIIFMIDHLIETYSLIPKADIALRLYEAVLNPAMVTFFDGIKEKIQERKDLLNQSDKHSIEDDLNFYNIMLCSLDNLANIISSEWIEHPYFQSVLELKRALEHGNNQDLLYLSKFLSMRNEIVQCIYHIFTLQLASFFDCYRTAFLDYCSFPTTTSFDHDQFLEEAISFTIQSREFIYNSFDEMSFPLVYQRVVAKKLVVFIESLLLDHVLLSQDVIWSKVHEKKQILQWSSDSEYIQKNLMQALLHVMKGGSGITMSRLSRAILLSKEGKSLTQIKEDIQISIKSK